MGLAGAGFGAARGLEQILAERLAAKELERTIQERSQRMEMEQAQLAQRAKESEIDAQQRQQQLDMQAGDRRARSNQQGVRRMLGEALVQGEGPMNSQDRRGMAALQVEAGDAPTLMIEPKQERDPIADHEAKARIDARYRRPDSSSARPQSQWVRMPDGSVVDINGVAPAGSKPYDAVAERSSQPANPAEAQDTAREAARLAKLLLEHKGLGGAFGVFDSMMPTMRQDTADAESLRDSLTSLLTLENTGKLKGVLSNTDMQILRQASSSLNPKMGDQAARAELQRIAQVMERAGGQAPAAPAGAAPAAPSKFTIIRKQ